ncbi:MAG: hypothetical protein A3K03_11810 [Bdellovibrionales bacterium RIFOXYD1_FULL_44_7]|nr:MAG: hypothetical protein A3K03_11810 [Bdellovibrionales bacterium RIFOXYD1_FULL_44_7]
MKSFIFDTLLEAENICNHQKEIKILKNGVFDKKKLVVYGPRNYGKTSVVKNIIIPEFKRKNKNSFIMFVDMMQVKDIQSINQRIGRAFEQAFSDAFFGKSLIESAKKLLMSLRPEFKTNSETGELALTLGYSEKKEYAWFQDVFKTINEKIRPQRETLIVFDEFQDISHVDEAEGLLRDSIQQLSKAAIIFMGSKKHLLSTMFAKPSAPFASIGEDVEFKPIPYEEYHDYIMQRFAANKVRMKLEVSTKLQDLLNRVPEPINIVCDYLLNNFENTEITEKIIIKALDDVIDRRRSRVEEYMSFFTKNEESVIIAIAKHGPIKQITSKNFLDIVKLTPRALAQMSKKLINHSVLEKAKEGFAIADPLLKQYLRKFR